MLKQLVFWIDKKDLAEGEERYIHALKCQVALFADEAGLEALLKHLADDASDEILQVLRDGLKESTPRNQFASWEDLDPDFKDLIVRLTNFDPAKRLTARETLEHRWFRDVPANC